MADNIVRIKVLGAGGAGGNAINDMITAGVAGVEFIAANTDAQDLDKSLADVRIQLGEKLTRGLGAGSNPEVGKEAAEEDTEKLKQLLDETDMLFITAGMGGGTGTGSSPVIAKVAKELGILTVGVVTKPFGFEGGRRRNNAERGIEELRQYVDSLVVIPNDKLFELPDKTITLQNAFKEANNILKIGIKGVADLIIGNGLINLDFADIKTTMENSGVAVLGFGDGEGENRAMKATEKALMSPLLEKSISGASKILLNISGSGDLTLMESQSIANIVREAAGKDADDVMFGVNIDNELKERIEVTIIANNFMDEVEKNEPFINVSKNTKDNNGETIQGEENQQKQDIDLPPWIRSNK
ncbi:MAG: cell division protein FtsZ [Fusobacterium sp. JB021]|nr:cell division protein FtsZ [Fusobacterium sp. JB021]MDP0507524.1 cell division protein FtsZ [Fusobacterium sp. JB019]